MDFQLALIQMSVECGNKNRNLAHAEELIGEAAANEADLALLPEAMDLGWHNRPARRMRTDSRR